MKRLALHSHILPALLSIGSDYLPEWMDELREPMAFDCSSLPTGFVQDTGEAILADCEERIEPVRLPYEHCYFQFSDDFAVIVSECAMINLGTCEPDEEGSYESSLQKARELSAKIKEDGPPPDLPRHHQLDFMVFRDWRGKQINSFAESISGAFGVCNEETGFAAKIHNENRLDEADEEETYDIRHGACLLLGVLALMNERLIGAQLSPDPHPERSAKRRKRRQFPTSSDVHTLTLNIGEIRKRAVAPRGMHESPRLHWRRGHSRILHRGSEFEKRIYVERCLVGDPSKGFIRKDYRLTFQPPMLEATP